MSGNTITFYMLILYSAALLLSLIRTQSLSENHDGFSISSVIFSADEDIPFKSVFLKFLSLVIVH